MSNRTTVKSNIQTQNVPTVTNDILTGMLNTELADNVVFREDVAVIQNSVISNITVDFSGKDRIDLTRTGGSLVITVANISDGEVKYLIVSKTAGQAVTWVNVTDITPIKSNANALTLVLYEIVRKGTYYFAKAWVENVKVATDSIEGVAAIASIAENNALAITNKMVTPGRQPSSSTTQKGLVRLTTDAEAGQNYIDTLAVTPKGLSVVMNNAITQPAWITAELEANWSGSLKYFKDNFGFVHVRADLLVHTGDINTSQLIWTIPAGYKPAVHIDQVIASQSNGDQTRYLHVIHAESAGNGLILYVTGLYAYHNQFTISFEFSYRSV